MDSKEFRRRGKEMVDYIADYVDNIEKWPVRSDMEPEYILQKIPSSAPIEGEDFTDILKDVDKLILPGITHIQHPNYYAFLPTGSSYPSILGDMLANGLSCMSSIWAIAPACTEIEMAVTDWVAKMIGLPSEFLHKSGTGGGVLENGASECILVTLLAARRAAIQRLKAKFPLEEDGVLLSKLVAYTSNLANYCVEKDAAVGLVKLRQLDVDENFSVRGSTLQQAIDDDRRQGLVPFFVCATFGTTACCSFDDIEELGEICTREGIWLHVDAAYAGGALICPEFQPLLRGIQNWGLTLSRRFRALKLWFVLRSYGIKGLQDHVRQHVRLAKLFEELVLADDNYEIVGRVTLGIVCFRLKGKNLLTKTLMRLIDESGQIFMRPSVINNRFFLRFVLCSPITNAEHVKHSWNIIATLGRQVLSTLADDKRRSNTIHDMPSNKKQKICGHIRE